MSRQYLVLVAVAGLLLAFALATYFLSLIYC